MKREPVYYFKTLDETGISEVPVDSLVIVENGDKGEDLEIYILDTDPNHIKTLTLRKYLQNNSHLYKMGGFATKENAKAIAVNKTNIAINVKDIKKLDDRVTINEGEILNNERDILKNENNIGYNRVQIDRNKKETDRVNRETIQNKKDIGHNHDHIEHNEQRIIALEGTNLHTTIKDITAPDKGKPVDLDVLDAEGEYNVTVAYFGNPGVPAPLVNAPAGFHSDSFRMVVYNNKNSKCTQQIFEIGESHIWIRSQRKISGQMKFTPWEKISAGSTQAPSNDSVLIEVDKNNKSYPLSTPVKESEIQKIYDDYFPKATWPKHKFPSFIVSQYVSFKNHPADILETKYNLRWIKVVMNKGMFAQEYAMISQVPNHTTTKNAHIAPIVSYIVL